MINLHGAISELPVKHVILEKLYFHIARKYSKDFLEESIETNIDWVLDNIEGAVIDLKKSVWAEKLQDHTISHSHYTSWWERFKAEVMPKWFKKRYPVKSTKVTHHFAQYAMFPNFKWHSNKEIEEFVIHETLNTWED